MNTQDYLACLVLLSLIVNLGDRLLTHRPGLLPFPSSGVLRFIFMGWSILLAVLAGLSLFRAIPVLFFVAVGTGWMVCLQAYAVFFRHSRSGATP
ncbi:MAG: hypothetical protein HYV60_00345 [Planctomycetia bacterium]|nr:hypothetical protein [Planctomycetia bacterium]